MVPELENPAVRELNLGNFRIIYRLGAQDRLEIARIRHVKRLFAEKDLTS